LKYWEEPFSQTFCGTFPWSLILSAETSPTLSRCPFTECFHPWGTSPCSSACCAFHTEEYCKHGCSWAIRVHVGCSTWRFSVVLGAGWLGRGRASTACFLLYFQEHLVSRASLNRCTVNA